MPSRLDNINEQRRQTLEQLRGRGINPYPNKGARTHTAQEALNLLKEQETMPKVDVVSITVGGRIMAHRKMGPISFMDLRDTSGKIQIMMDKQTLDDANKELLKDLDIGDIILADGVLFRTKTGEPTVKAGMLTLLAKSLQPLPEKWHGLSDTDKRYRQRYVDLIANTGVKDVFIARSRVIAAIREFLDRRGFIEVETPVLQASAGGALAAPFITHHNTLDQDFYLRIATELHLKRLIVGGFDKVYEIGHVFRNEGISTTHSPEYTLLESYEAYADYHDVMEMTEEMVCKVSQQVLGTLEIKYGNDVVNLKSPWRRITLRDAVREYSGIDYVKYPTAAGLREKMRSLKMEADPAKNWAKLVDELLKTCVRPGLIQPTIIHDYPASMSPLAKSKPGRERVVERFQAVAGGLEIANAYSELNDPIEQRERFEEQMKDRHGDEEEQWTIDEDYLTALEYGMPPAGGLGVGIDRLVMLLTNQQSIREVILFPQLREKE